MLFFCVSLYIVSKQFFYQPFFVAFVCGISAYGTALMGLFMYMYMFGHVVCWIKLLMLYCLILLSLIDISCWGFILYFCQVGVSSCE